MQVSDVFLNTRSNRLSQKKRNIFSVQSALIVINILEFYIYVHICIRLINTVKYDILLPNLIKFYI